MMSNLDLFEYAIEKYSDSTAFESMATEVLFELGHHELKRMGRVDDGGIDAFEKYTFWNNEESLIVYQYTLQVNIKQKITDTIIKLKKEGTVYTKLVLVTLNEITPQKQLSLIKEVKEKDSIVIEFIEREEFKKILSSSKNAIFSKYFPDAETHFKDYFKIKSELEKETQDLFERSLIKSSLLFTLNDNAQAVRKNVFDNLIFSCILQAYPKASTVDSIVSNLKDNNVNVEIESGQLKAALERLVQRKFINQLSGNIVLHENAIGKINSIGIGEETKFSKFSKYILSTVLNELGQETAFSREQKAILIRNIKATIIDVFSFVGAELVADILPPSMYKGFNPNVIRRLNETLSKGVISKSIIAPLYIKLLETIISPPKTYRDSVLSLKKIYVATQLMKLDPTIIEFQATKVSQKTFYLETDFILNCLVREVPEYEQSVFLIKKLQELGCKIIIPDFLIQECIKHAEIAQKTVDFFGEDIFKIPHETANDRIWNVFAKGYYYKYVGVSSPPPFQRYLTDNYYSSDRPYWMLTQELKANLGDKILFQDAEKFGVVSEDEIKTNPVTAKAYQMIQQGLEESKKHPYRDQDEKSLLALRDIFLFYKIYQKNVSMTGGKDRILGYDNYIITNAGIFKRIAREMNASISVSVRPDSILATFEVLTTNRGQKSLIFSYESKLLEASVDPMWDDINKLVALGVDLNGKSLSRLRDDFDKGLHQVLIKSFTKDPEKITSTDVVEISEQVKTMGYDISPALETLKLALQKEMMEKESIAQKLKEAEDLKMALEQRLGDIGRKQKSYAEQLKKKR